MTKLKTHSGAKKRVKFTKGSGKKGGKAMKRPAACRHLMTNKDPQKAQHNRGREEVAKADHVRLKSLLPYDV